MTSDARTATATGALTPSRRVAYGKWWRWYLVLLRVTVLGVGIWIAVASISTTASSDIDRSGWPWQVTAVAVAQLLVLALLFVFTLVERSTRVLRGGIAAWYYLAAAFAPSAVVQFVKSGTVEPATAIGMAAAALVLVVTADVSLGWWNRLPTAHGDIALFLATTHTLVLVVMLTFVTNAWGVAADVLSNEVATTGVLGVTLLAFPICAGMWVRLLMARAHPERGRVTAVEQRNVLKRTPSLSPSRVSLSAVAVGLLVFVVFRRQDRT